MMTVNYEQVVNEVIIELMRIEMSYEQNWFLLFKIARQIFRNGRRCV